MIVGNDDLCPFKVGKHVTGNKFPALVVAVRVVRLKHAQTVADGQPWRDDQKSPCKLLAVGPAHRIDGLPGNQHSHYGGLACACGQFKCQSHQVRIGVVVGIGQMFKKAFPGLYR